MKALLFTLLFFGLSTTLLAQEEKVYKNLDEALKNANDVYHLDLSGQKLSELPKGFKKLKSLRKINLSNNNFTNLPNFGNFYELEELNLSNNNLSDIPSFIRLNGDIRNLEIENNPVVKIKTSTDPLIEITNEKFEGTINLSKEGSHEISKGNEGMFLKVYLDAKKKYWMEIHEKNETTNENLINGILNKKNEHFNYFINKHSTFDTKTESIPAYVMYNYSNTSGKVWISSNKFLVVFDNYYITLNTNEKYIPLYDVKKFLAIAITYQPKEKSLKVDLFSKLENITAASFLAAAQVSKFEKINDAVIEPKITKEIIYTMKAGETVAFTNEYQLGIELKEAEYYIYIKKGGKYYLHTAENVFGPYDDLNSANPNNPNGDDLINGFNVTKGSSKYIISGGKELGPYPKESYCYKFDGLISVTESVNKEYYTTIDGKRMGPFNSWPNSSKTNDGFVTTGKDANNKYILYVNGDLKEKGIESSGYSFVSDGYLAYDYTKEGKKYVYFNEKNYGPYDAIYNLKVVDDLLTYQYKVDNKWFYSINDKQYGPYEKIEYTFNVEPSAGFKFKNDGKFYVQITNGKQEGPFSKSPSFSFDEKSKKYLIYGEKQGAIEVIYCGNKIGEFKNVEQTYGKLHKATFNSEKLPGIEVQNMDGTYSIYISDRILGPFNGKPAYFYDSTTQKEAFVYPENNNGKEEYFLIQDNKKVGPFKSIVYNTNLSSGSALFYEYEFALEDFNNKFYLIYPDKIIGPLDDCKFKDEYRPNNESIICVINGDTYFYHNDKFYGPAVLPKLSNEKQYPNLNFFGGEQGGVYSGTNYQNNEQPCVINNIAFKDYYNVIGFNNTNYAADTYWTTDRRFILNNKLYTKGVLNYAYDDVNKVFYWLTVEGKNIIRNKVKF